MKRTKKYTFFWKDKLAQWNMQSFKDNKGVEYNCAEQYMMAKKAELFNDKISYQKIMKAKTPKEQQNLGRKVNGFNEDIWDANKQIILYKFEQNKDLLDILLSTKGTILVEASPYDKIWGVGLSDSVSLILDKENWKGKNLLGYTLTALRDNYFLK